MTLIVMENKKNPARPQSIGRQLIFAAGAVSNLCQQLLEPRGITLGQWVVLAALWRQDGLTIGDLAAYSGNDTPATSRLVDRMAAKSLITRRADPKDRRAVRIYLASEGEALRDLQNFQETINEMVLADLSDKEAEALYRLLQHVEDTARLETEKVKR